MKLKYQFETMEMDGKTVAVAVGDDADKFHGMIKMNSTAYAIFSELANEITLDQLISNIANKYGKEPQEVAQSVTNYVDKLIEQGVVD